MKIVFLARYLPQEGSTIHMYTLAEKLIESGNEVHIISAGPKNNKSAWRIFNQSKNNGILHHKVLFPLKPNFDFYGKLVQLLNYIIATPYALYLLFKINPDVIHVHYPVTSFIAKIYGKIKKKKFITTYHTSGIPKHILHRRADYAVAISRELEVDLTNNLGYRQEEIRLIFNGVSQQKFNSCKTSDQKINIKNKHGLPLNEIIIGYVGSFSKIKGIDILLAAASKIKDKNYKILLLGDGDKKWVYELITKYNLNERVLIKPFQDPVEFYEIFDIFVLPSRQEGFPLVPLEAMMMGVPTIRSNVEGAYDQIKHGENGFIFTTENYNELSVYIENLINNNELRFQMGEDAKLYASNNFSEKKMINELLELYELVK